MLKEAFSAKVIAEGQVWIDMLDDRNRLSHTYDAAVFSEAVEAIAALYLPAMEALHQFLQREKLTMKVPGLTARELEMIAGVLQRYPEIIRPRLFGSRAKGTHTERSDVDLAVCGNGESHRQAEAIASDFDDLPLPYRFEVIPFEHVKLAALREHIERVGIPIYPRAPFAD